MTGHFVHWEPTGLSVRVLGDKPLLFGLLNAGVPVLYACMQGRCRSCRAYLLEGAVHHDSASVLATTERAAGAVLLCAAYPVSSELAFALYPSQEEVKCDHVELPLLSL